MLSEVVMFHMVQDSVCKKNYDTGQHVMLLGLMVAGNNGDALCQGKCQGRIPDTLIEV